MGKKLLIGVMVLILISFLSGCTQGSVCGDGVCSPGEELTCPQDCGEIKISGNSSFVINIVPGKGVNEEDLSLFADKVVNVCEFEDCENIEEEDGLVVRVNSVYDGFYWVSGSVVDKEGVPLNIDASNIYVVDGEEEVNVEDVSVIKGIKYSLSVVDSSGELIDPSLIEIIDYCEKEFYEEEYVCSKIMGDFDWDYVFGENPFVDSIEVDSEELLFYLENKNYLLKLGYDGIVKDFEYSFVQGINEIVFDVSS